MRLWPLAVPLIVLGLIPATALGHAPSTGSYSTASLRSAAKACRSYSPRMETRIRRVERLALGPRHAAEHARARTQSRHEACTPHGTLRKSFVKKVRRARSTVKRLDATGPTSQVGQWSGGIPLDVVAIHTTLMPNGKVLFFYNNPSLPETASARVEVWDPVTQTGVRRDVPGNIWCAGQTVLADGRVLVVGGTLQNQVGGPGGAFKGLNQIWIFDPATETWLRGPDMHHGRWYPTATKMADGRVLITAGWDESGNGASANNQDLEVYTPAADGHGPGTVQVVATRDIDYYPHQYVLPDGRVILAGPRHVDTAIINPSNWTFTDIPDLNINRDYGYGAGVLLPGPPSGSTKVLLIGGANNVSDTSTATTEQFDAANPSAGWSFKAPLPDSRRNVNGVILPDGKILVVGGNTTGASDGYRFESESYDPATNTWTPLAAQAEGRGYHSTAILLPDARVLSAGDDTVAGGGWTSDVAEIFSPPYLFKGARPAITSAPTSVGYNAPFTIGTGDQVSRAVLVAPGSTTHANDMNQRHVELSITPTTGGVLATSPPSANVAPPGPYMLFLLNSAGVPSVARFVSVGTGPPPPPDTTPPTVSLTAPAAGATLSGTTAVSATAGDDIAVAGVQFTLDGANLGAEDTGSPYSVSWNTTTATNGTHTLRAVARDAAGNTTTSAPVSVTVSNTGTPPPAGLVAAYGFEETSGTDGRRLLGRRQHRHDRRRGRPHGRRKDRPGDRLRRRQRPGQRPRRQLARSHHRHDPRGLGAAGHAHVLARGDPEGAPGLAHLLAVRQHQLQPAPVRHLHLCGGQERRDHAPAHHGRLDPPGGHLRRRQPAPLQERGAPDHHRRPGRAGHLGQPAADRRQHDLGRVLRRAHRRGAGLQPGPLGRRDHHRHDHAGRRRRPAAARHHPPHGERQLAGGRRQRGRHHPGQRHRRRQRRRGRGPVHPRRRQPGRRGHRLALLRERGTPPPPPTGPTPCGRSPATRRATPPPRRPSASRSPTRCPTSPRPR